MKGIKFAVLQKRIKSALEYGLSFSQIDDFMLCPWKWVYRILGLQSPGRVSPSIYTGCLVHEAIASILRSRKLKPDVHISSETIKRTIKKAKISFDGNAQDKILYQAIAHTLVDSWYRLPMSTIFTNTKEYLGIEKKIEVDCERIRVYSKVDYAFKDFSNELHLVDWKVKSRFNEIDTSYFPLLSLQGKLGAYALYKNLDIAPVTFHYVIFRYPQIKQGKKSLSAYLIDIRKDIAKRPEFYFQSYPVTFLEKDLDDFEDELESIICNMRNAVENMYGFKDIPHHTSNCLGNYACDYLEACAKKDFGCLVKKEF